MARKKTIHPINANHEPMGVNFSIRAEASITPTKTMAKAIINRLVLFIVHLR